MATLRGITFIASFSQRWRPGVCREGERGKKEREEREREREAERDQIYESVLFYNYSSRPIDGGRFETTVEHKQVNCKYTYDSNAEMILIMN